MNMQFGFGGYDPYMMMGYGNFNPGGFGGFGGMGGYGGFFPFGGGFPNYYPMFNPMALYSMGQRFYSDQFQPREDLRERRRRDRRDPRDVREVPVEDDLLPRTESGQDQIAEVAPREVPSVAPTDGLNNPMNFQKAGRFTTAADRTSAANQILTDTQGGGYKGVRKLVRRGKVKKAQKKLSRIQARNTAKEG